MNICIVEDNVALLKNLTALLDGEKDIRVTSSHTTAEAALAHTDWPATDILLVDINLPQMSGIDLIRAVNPVQPQVNILVYTVHEDREIVLNAIRAGACGYLIKGSSSEELLAALREIAAGGAPMSPKIARKVLAELKAPAAPAAQPDGDEQLTLRESETLRALSEGYSYKEIAATFGVSPHTVHTHIKNIYRKLHAHGRREAISIGRESGLI